MSAPDDDLSVDPRLDLDDRAADALLSGHAVAAQAALGAFVSELRALADVPPPTPSLALAAMLDAGLTADTVVLPAVPGPRSTTWSRLTGAVSWRTAKATKGAVSWRTAPDGAVSWRRRSWALPLQLSLAGSGCLALVLVAAAANELPDAAQTAVANVVEAITPLDVPRPSDDRPAPDVTPTPSPVPAVDGPAQEGEDPPGRAGSGTGDGSGDDTGVDRGDGSADDSADDPRGGSDDRSGGSGDSQGQDSSDDRGTRPDDDGSDDDDSDDDRRSPEPRESDHSGSDDRDEASPKPRDGSDGRSGSGPSGSDDDHSTNG